jgi:hypothetical protein
MAQVFFSDIIRLHGVPRSIVSDKDPVFMSSFWSKIMRLMGTKLHLSSVFHPQFDGQTAAANRVIVIYLRYFTGDRPRQWLGVAAVGRVYLQHGVPDLPPRHIIPGGLWA